MKKYSFTARNEDGKNLNWPNINIDYQSLYNNGKKYSSTEFDKLVRYVKELRMKYKNQQNG